MLEVQLITTVYMAVAASRVMEKYPTFILARPEVFRRPWDSVVQPEEILVPGQKFYVVPIWTVKKLKQRISRNMTMISLVARHISL